MDWVKLQEDSDADRAERMMNATAVTDMSNANLTHVNACRYVVATRYSETRLLERFSSLTIDRVLLYHNFLPDHFRSPSNRTDKSMNMTVDAACR